VSRVRTSLAQRITALAVGIAVITAVVAGTLSANLIRTANETAARAQLAQLADVAEATADVGANPQAGQLRARQILRALSVQFAVVNRVGTIAGPDRVARDALQPADVAQLLAGGSVSATRTVDDRRVYLEARSTGAGGLALVLQRSDALRTGNLAIRRTVWALLIAVVLAVLLGWAVAYRIARPLRRTAAAARSLASGRRDVAVHAHGPTEVAEVAEAINTLSVALTASEARQQDFLLSVSHDLRTPLTAITGYAESLAEGVVTPTELPAVGSVLLAESRRLDRLVSDLLDLARLGAEDFRIDRVDIDVITLATDTAVVWRSRCASANVRFSLELPAESTGPLMTCTDPGRLRQVLDGLLENALRVTPTGGIIVLAARPERDPAGRAVLAVEIRDSGPGLTEQDLEVAFDRSALYNRYRGVRPVGTGLGLAIVAGLVHRLGAGVEAGRSAEGGARFTVRLLPSRLQDR
jgi:two-component system OmpR family sensor kinase